jgi:hypothetical protein
VLVQAAPALVVAAALATLALALDHGSALGFPRGALDAIGRSYFALLISAPLLVYPFAWRRGLPPRFRIALSLLPGFLWWCTEIGVRLRWHSIAESLWLTLSPFNLFHLYVGLVCLAIADVACRLSAREPRPRTRTIVISLAALLIAPVAIGASIFPFLQGYRAVFLQDLLPLPNLLPGPVDRVERVRHVARPPNFVFILSDDHRHDFAGYAGHPFVETPALDRLASEGVRFTRAYVTSSLCSPSRASFLTGTYPNRQPATRPRSSASGTCRAGCPSFAASTTS